MHAKMQLPEIRGLKRNFGKFENIFHKKNHIFIKTLIWTFLETLAVNCNF